MQLYAQDSDELLPPTAVNDPNGNEILWPDMINAYVNNKHLRLCPSDGNDKTNSYGLNELTFVDLTDGPRPTLSLAAFQSSSQTVMLGELGRGKIGSPSDLTTIVTDAYKLTALDMDMNDQYDARPAARHNVLTNVAFMDGHDKAMRLDQFYVGQTPPDKWFCTDPDNAGACHGD